MNKKDKLDRMLGEYFAAAPDYSFTFKPEAQKVPAPVPIRRFRVIASAAAVVLVGALSLTVYFLFGNKANDPITLSPTPESSVTPAEQGTEEGDAPTDNAAVETTATSAATGNTEKPTVKSTSATAPTSSGHGVSPTSATERVTGTQPTQKPTQNPTQNASAPTAAPTQAATSPPTQKPTESPTQKPTAAPIPSGSGSTAPKDYPQSEVDIFICISIPPQDPGIKIYCGIYDPDGNLLGDPDIFSEQHEAELINYPDGESCALYYPFDHGLVFSRYGKYPYIIYDQNGNELVSYYMYAP